jgi:hypothetical protein
MGFHGLKFFFLCNSFEWITNIGVIMKTNNKSFTEMNMKEIGRYAFFIFWLEVGQHSNWNFSETFLAVPKTLASKKTLGQDLSIGPSLDQIGLTSAEK